MFGDGREAEMKMISQQQNCDSFQPFYQVVDTPASLASTAQVGFATSIVTFCLGNVALLGRYEVVVLGGKIEAS